MYKRLETNLTMIQILKKTPFLNTLIYLTGKMRAKGLLGYFDGQLDKKENILDLGAGMGNVSELLIEDGHNVTPVDVVDLSFSDKVEPLIYDGITLPFQSDTFNVVLLITVLHHTPDPEVVIREAMRVGDRVVIIEDIYASKVHKYLTFLFDSLLNLEFVGHPHTNKTDKEWKSLFHKLRLNLTFTNYHTSLVVFRHATYIVEK